MNNVVVYARYSSASQTEQSIEGQLRVCHEFATRNGYNVLNEYIDRATTGTTDDRPEFLQMIEDASKKEFDFILVYKLDRFSRNRYDSVFYKHKLKQFGVRVISAMEAISDTQEGRLVEGLLEMMAEMYSHDLSQKVKRGLRESALKGTYTGGHNLLGYKVVDKKVVIDDVQAPVVKFAFEQYAQGKRKKQIVEELNSKGYRTNSGTKFTINSFNNTMRNRKYIGENIFNGIVSENYPQLVSKELFDKVQSKLNERKHAPAAAKAKQEYLLTGKAYCGHCGGKLVGISGTSKTKMRHAYYACSTQYKDKNVCDKKYEKKGYLEWYVVEQTLLYILNPDCANEIAELVLKEFENNINAVKIKSYEKQLAKIERELDRCFQLMLHAESEEAIKRADSLSKDLEIQKTDVKTEISKLKLASAMKHTKEDILAWLKIFTTGDVLSPEYQRRIIHTFVNSVYLFDDKVVIYYNIEGGKQVSYIEMLESIEGLDDIAEFNGGKNEFVFEATHSAKGSQIRTPYKIIFVNGLFGIIVSRKWHK